MTHYLFEQPWPVVVVLGCVAFALLAAGMRRRHKGSLIAAAVAGALAVAVYVTAQVVTTDVEVVERRTRAVVAATAPPLDLPLLRQSIADAAAVTLPNGATLPLRLALSDELAAAVVRHSVTGQSVSGMDSEQTSPTTVLVRLNVRTTLTGEAYRPVDTRWLLTWRRTEGQAGDDAWRIVAVEWLELLGREPTGLGGW